MDISQLIAEHGACFYLLAFIWTFLEGETFVLFAAFAAAQGLLNPILLLIATWLGSFSGDQTYFWIGRYFGLPVLTRFPKWRHGVESALYWLERYNAGFILSFRFIYGVRNFSSFAMGLSAVHWKRFLTLNFAAAGLWAGSFVALGYFLGHAFRTLLGRIVTECPIARPKTWSARPALTAISASPFEFSYQKASPLDTSEKVRRRASVRPPMASRVSAGSEAARMPVIALP
jgi:membrane protein DedA with SNARE-associated domain